jgi:hypothetical protein
MIYIEVYKVWHNLAKNCGKIIPPMTVIQEYQYRRLLLLYNTVTLKSRNKYTIESAVAPVHTHQHYIE